MMTWIFVALVVVAFVVWSATRNRAIFADRHVAELARNVAQVKAGALERGNDADAAPPLSRTLVSDL